MNGDRERFRIKFDRYEFSHDQYSLPAPDIVAHLAGDSITLNAGKPSEWTVYILSIDCSSIVRRRDGARVPRIGISRKWRGQMISWDGEAVTVSEVIDGNDVRAIGRAVLYKTDDKGR